MILEDLWQVLYDNLAEGIHTTTFKNDNCFLEKKIVKTIWWNINVYLNKLDEKLKTILKNTFKFSNNDINEFILLLRKGLYPYESMHDWEKFNETTLHEKE